MLKKSDTAEERISEPKDKSLENIQSKAQKDLSEKRSLGLQSTDAANKN